MESTLIDIFDKTYEFCDQIQFRDYERASYETLCSRVFPGLSFEKWYQAGYWDGNLFNPHVLKDADDIVAAVSLNTMLLKIANNSPKTYIQLGGVMTDPKYRKQGLSSALIDNIMAKWNDKCQGFYLFANEKVRDFYPRFGFKEVDEFQYRMDICEGDEKAVKLNMSNKNDIEILHQHYKIGNPFSIINVDNFNLLMFYCLKYNKNDVYYVESEDAVIIAGHEKEALVVYDIFCNSDCSIENIISAVADENTETAYFGFPLKKTKHCKISRYEEEDNILFIYDNAGSDNLADFLQLPEFSGKLMFPLLSHT